MVGRARDEIIIVRGMMNQVLVETLIHYRWKAATKNGWSIKFIARFTTDKKADQNFVISTNDNLCSILKEWYLVENLLALLA